MRQVWLTMALVAVATLLASAVDAQRWSQVRNMNTHEGKYGTGGFGFSVGTGFMGSSTFSRESLSTESVGGALEAVYTKNESQTVTRSLFGADIDFQIGSDNSVIGTDFGLEIYSFSIGTNATRVDERLSGHQRVCDADVRRVRLHDQPVRKRIP